MYMYICDVYIHSYIHSFIYTFIRYMYTYPMQQSDILSSNYCLKCHVDSQGKQISGLFAFIIFIEKVY